MITKLTKDSSVTCHMPHEYDHEPPDLKASG